MMRWMTGAFDQRQSRATAVIHGLEGVASAATHTLYLSNIKRWSRGAENLLLPEFEVGAAVAKRPPWTYQRRTCLSQVIGGLSVTDVTFVVNAVAL
jgi:hypothetical protein